MSGLPLYIPVMIYCESPLNAQSQTHRCAVSFNSVIKVKSAVRHILAVWSADVVANNLEKYIAFNICNY
jgi:ABC-type transport system involved in cytochrome c biogenesis permease component